MIINSAMINSKDVLEIKLNNSIIYSATPATNYNYTLSFANSGIVTPPPDWMKTSCLVSNSTNGKFIISGIALINGNFTTQYGGQNSYLGFDISQAVTAIKLTINYYTYNKNSDSRVYSQIRFGEADASSFASVSSNVTMYNTEYIINTSGNTARTDITYTISLEQINSMKSNRRIAALNFSHYNGWSTSNDTRLYIYSVKIEEV